MIVVIDTQSVSLTKFGEFGNFDQVVVVVVVAIVNTQKSRLILVNMEIGCKDPFANR